MENQNKEVSLKEFMLSQFKDDAEGLRVFKDNIIKSYSKWCCYNAAEQSSYPILRTSDVLEKMTVTLVEDYWFIKLDLSFKARLQWNYYPVFLGTSFSRMVVSITSANVAASSITECTSDERPPNYNAHQFVSQMHNLYNEVRVELGFHKPYLPRAAHHPDFIAKEMINPPAEIPTEDPPLYALQMATASKDMVQLIGRYVELLNKFYDPHAISKLSITEYREITKEMETLHENISPNSIHNAFYGD